MKTKVKRKYRISDAKLISEANVLKLHLQADLQDFILYDPIFNLDYLNEFGGLISAVEEVPDDLLIKGEIVTRTSDRTIVMEACRKYYNDVRFFVNKAFNESKAKQTEFGFKIYDKVRKSPEKMLKFLKKVYNAAVKNKDALIAVNFTEVMINRIMELRTELENADSNQGDAVSARPAVTEERINAYNLLFDRMKFIRKAGKNIYQNDYGKQYKYLTKSKKIIKKK